jgi:hypothetical protein
LKTTKNSLVFTISDVSQFIEVLGDSNPIYKCIESAKSYGFETIPLPPTMPMFAYREIEIPWELIPPVIHRKQKCMNHQRMYIDKVYIAQVTMTSRHQKKQITIITQTLEIYDDSEDLCFTGISELIAGGLIENN